MTPTHEWTRSAARCCAIKVFLKGILAWHNSVIWVTWRMHTSDLDLLLDVAQKRYSCVTWLSLMRDMTHSYAWHCTLYICANSQAICTPLRIIRMPLQMCTNSSTYTYASYELIHMYIRTYTYGTHYKCARTRQRVHMYHMNSYICTYELIHMELIIHMRDSAHYTCARTRSAARWWATGVLLRDVTQSYV